MLLLLCANVGRPTVLLYAEVIYMRNKNGFTLIEIMASIAIILILSSAVAFSITSYITRAHSASDRAGEQQGKYDAAQVRVDALLPTEATVKISGSAISGVTQPVKNATAVTSIADTPQYSATISWSPALSGGKFATKTIYTATITLTPKTGYTLTDITANFFTVANATATNAAGSGVVTALFLKTAN